MGNDRDERYRRWFSNLPNYKQEAIVVRRARVHARENRVALLVLCGLFLITILVGVMIGRLLDR